MRKELDLPRIDDSKLDEAEALIASIAAREPGTAAAELEALSALTGKLHSEVEFLEYWSWTDLDTLARLTLAPEPPCVPDLTWEETQELVRRIQNCSVTGQEWAMRYDLQLPPPVALPAERHGTSWPPARMWRSLRKSCCRRPGDSLFPQLTAPGTAVRSAGCL